MCYKTHAGYRTHWCMETYCGLGDPDLFPPSHHAGNLLPVAGPNSMHKLLHLFILFGGGEFVVAADKHIQLT